MKLHLKLLAFTLLFLIAIPAIAIPVIEANPDLDIKEPSSIVLALTPFITLLGVWFLKKISPLITGTVTLIAVPIVSVLITWVTSIITGDASWIAQILAGTGAVLLHQISEYLSSSKA